MTADNPFATSEGALRYQRGRPFHHPQAIGKIFSILQRERVHRALDVACGTGLSTVALSERADLAVGVDPVESMVRLAPSSQNTVLALGEAEKLPFPSDAFELVTVSSGVHWFDQETFFAEAARVLVSRGWLAIYDHFFEGCPDERDIDAWLSQRYETRYPPPPRAARADRPTLATPDFIEVAAFEYDDPISFTQDELVAYLLSHSNTIAPATQQRETTLQTETWLREETGRWFRTAHNRTFLFRGAVRSLRRTT